MKNAKRGLTAVVAAMALTLTACSGGSDSGDAASGGEGGGKGELHLGVAYETTNYHPSETSSALALGTNWHVMEGLYEFNMNDYSTYPALAAGEPTEVSDTELEIALRDGAKFSDGTDVTVDDVVSSFDRAMEDGNLYATMLDFIDSVEAKDDNTITIKLDQPFSLVENRLAVVKIVPESASDEDLTHQPIGTGPYAYESITDSQITAIPNEHYNGEYPAGASKLVWDVIKDDTARNTAASADEIDVMEAVPAESVDMLAAANMTVDEVDGFNLPFLLFNTQKEPFNDPKVRQAFFYAIDTEKLISNNMDGKAKPAKSFLPESHPNFHEASTVYNYDPEKAKELLDEAGVDDLSITLVNTDHPWIESLAPQIQNDLKEVGIDTALQSEASASLYSNHLDVDDPTFDVALAPGDPSVFGNDPALLINWWYGDNVWTQKRSFWQESDPEAYQELNDIVQEATTLEGDEQQQKWNEALDLLSEEVPIYPLFHRTMITAYNADKVSDFKSIGTTGLWAVPAQVSE
ncbi:ABC-type dipeptide transport system, periplasmic component [Corynebacterium camporealensis]|uniref:ABC-type dipeptide transport system, periplasmic component n=1 Tax=Corynebacterium camporealensis TaxID=161896 RepID=A0A0F6QWW7_9CORY|nr:ABC transporter substrate-binding protein [Corynebacterium camporealensis]AKE38323.1 ABC-type dipeptide transport system, periplasmic component [Corynebacterium camporealensis]AVH87627.1 ABC-type dipeptide transport system, periplasmic component [Corynebacterium camporealensis]